MKYIFSGSDHNSNLRWGSWFYAVGGGLQVILLGIFQRGAGYSTLTSVPICGPAPGFGILSGYAISKFLRLANTWLAAQ